MALKYDKGVGIQDKKYIITEIEAKKQDSKATYFPLNIEEQAAQKALIFYAASIKAVKPKLSAAIWYLVRFKSYRAFQINGFRKKYDIQKLDGTPIDPKKQYYILRLDKDPYAREALKRYATLIESERPRLSRDIIALSENKTWKGYGMYF